MFYITFSNAIAQRFGTSIYDSIIQLKDLAYLPDIHGGETYQKTAGQVMLRSVPMLHFKSTYYEVAELLHKHKDLQAVPLVEADDSRVLIGSITRQCLKVRSYF